MARDQGPVTYPRPHPYVGMRRANGYTGDVLLEPGDHLVAHDAHALRLVRLYGKAVNERI